MRPRQSPPRLWLMTDERMGDALWAALEGLPRGSGVIFRHYHSPQPERRRLFDKVRGVTRRRRLVLVLAGRPRHAIGWRADGAHGVAQPYAARPMLRTAPAHNRREFEAAARARVDVVFLSPVFPTRSHPGGSALGRVRFGLVVRARRHGAALPRVIALGGMNARRFRRLVALGADGWAAIDAWTAEPASVRT